MIKNSLTSWGVASRFFHWSVAFLVLLQIPIGFWMVDEYELYSETYADDSMVMLTSLIHHTLGFVILIMVAMRLTWRFSHESPALPATFNAYQKMTAYLTHMFLYSLLLIYPFSGWAALSAYDGEFPIFFFVWDSVPGIVPQVADGQPMDYLFFAEIHRYCWRIGAVILGMHISAALWHHYIVKDNILTRMIRG